MWDTETGRRQTAKGPVIKMRQYEVRGAEKPNLQTEEKGEGRSSDA